MRTLPRCTHLHVRMHTGLTAALWAFVALLCRQAQMWQRARGTHVLTCSTMRKMIFFKMLLYIRTEQHTFTSFLQPLTPSQHSGMALLLSVVLAGEEAERAVRWTNRQASPVLRDYVLVSTGCQMDSWIFGRCSVFVYSTLFPPLSSELHPPTHLCSRTHAHTHTHSILKGI